MPHRTTPAAAKLDAELADDDLDAVAGGMIFVRIPGMGDNSVSTDMDAPETPTLTTKSPSTPTVDASASMAITPTVRTMG